LKQVPLKTVPETVVDTNRLTPLEQKIYNLSTDEWNKIEDRVLE